MSFVDRCLWFCIFSGILRLSRCLSGIIVYMSPKKSISKKKKEENEVPIDGHEDVVDMILKNNAAEHSFFSDPEVVFEGQLAIDMAETGGELVVMSTIAGADPSDIDIHIEGDTLTIRGKRQSSFEGKDRDYFYKECYWGVFSRSIMLPVDVKGDGAKAEFHNGLLTIRIPKLEIKKSIPIEVIEE